MLKIFYNSIIINNIKIFSKHKIKQIEEVDKIGNYKEVIISILFLKSSSGSKTHYVLDMYRDNAGAIKFTHDINYELDPNFKDPTYL